MYKRFTLGVVISIVLILIFFAGSIIIIDPLFHYHAPLGNLKPYIHSEIQQNRGIARQLEYDSIILGSSMAENFDGTWFNEKFDCKTIKLTYQAAKIKNYSIMLKESFGSRELKNVFISLDPDTLIDDEETIFFKLPEHIYDDNILNDVNYFFNKDIFFDYLIPYIQKNINGTVEDAEKAYQWGNDPNVEFSKEAVLRSISWDVDNMPDWQDKDLKHYTQNTINNINNIILPYVINNPDTEFYIFYPPYSIAWWNGVFAKSQSNAYFSVLQASMELLLPYDNVHMYYYQDEESIIYDFNEYKDYNHYSPKINQFMVDRLGDNDYLLTKDNYLDKLNNMRRIVDTYDYSQLSAG